MVLANVIAFAVLKILHNFLSTQKSRSWQITVEVIKITKRVQCNLTIHSNTEERVIRATNCQLSFLYQPHPFPK